MCLHKFSNHLLIGIAIMVAVIMQDAVAQSDLIRQKIGFASGDVCKPDRIDVPQVLKAAPAGDTNEQPIRFEAEHIESASDTQIKLSGNAEVTQGKRGIYAGQIEYNQQTARATALDKVRFYTVNGTEVRADSFHFQMDSVTGAAHNVRVQFVDETPHQTARAHQNYSEDYSLFAPLRNKASPATEQPSTDDQHYVRARATADSIEFEGAGRERLHNATFSNCKQDNDDVVLSAKELELDHTKGIGIAKSVSVKFKRIPLFYLPIVSFPIANKRKSGFLLPDIRSERASGTIIRVPYYINIAPNHDATVIPKLLSKRGAQLYGEYRYLLQKTVSRQSGQSGGIVKAEVLPSDAVFNHNRYALSYQHKQDFNDHWSSQIDFQTLSDTHYLADFNSSFGATSLSHVPQHADLQYRSHNLFFQARVTGYQIANDSVNMKDNPYRRLPEINLNLKARDFAPLKYGIDSTFTRFTHRDNTRVSGIRWRSKPYISLPIRFGSGYFIPKISLQATDYTLNHHAGDAPLVTVPIISIDSGLFFERVLKRNDYLFFQTLEPRLFYVNIPAKRKQVRLPNFDSSVMDNNSFSHLFRENRFFGGDRVGDTEQITLGLTSKIIDSDGQQRLKLSMGQIFFLADRQIGLPATIAPETEKQSDFLTEVTAQVTADWNIRGFARIGSQSNEVKFARISADYYHSARRNAVIGYSRDKDSKDAREQMNLEFKLPLARRWQLDGEIKYATRENEARDLAIGISYDNCCWSSKLLVERYLVAAGNFKNRVTIALELGVLGKGNHHF